MSQKSTQYETLIHADRRMDGGTGMAKLIGAFNDHAN